MPLWLHWILLGLLSGALAKFLVPGRDPAGCLITIALGIAGAFVGGWLATTFGWGEIDQTRIDLPSLAFSTLGAMLLLVLGRLLFGKRG